MIVTQLLGGLGNQLFQYAVGRTLASRHGVPLALDISCFETYSLRPYKLHHFAIEGVLLSDSDRRRMGLDLADQGTWARRLRRLRGERPMPRISERSFEFDAAVLDAPDQCYLQGYWQSPKYFLTIDSQIRREFTVRDAQTGKNLEASQRIADSLAVSVHVRRGDYVQNPTTHSYHGTCGPQYYEAAERILRSRFGPLHLFVFSDDPDWADSNLRFESPVTILKHNAPSFDYEDLRLMTECKHHIIANSTFSWWGAWLCPNPCKTVVAPRNWFREARHSTADLIPADWLRV